MYCSTGNIHWHLLGTKIGAAALYECAIVLPSLPCSISRGLEEYCRPRAAPAKLNVVHFCCQIWHPVRTFFCDICKKILTEFGETAIKVCYQVKNWGWHTARCPVPAANDACGDLCKLVSCTNCEAAVLCSALICQTVSL